MLIVKRVTVQFRVLATMLLVIASPPLLAASFDCAKAQSRVEKLICSNPEMSDLDSRLGKVYQGVLEKVKPEEKQNLVNEQKHWLSQARNVCAKETCLKHAYWSRLAVLENYFEPRSPLYAKESDKAVEIKQILDTAPLYESKGSPNKPVCQEMFAALKQMNGIRLVEPIVQSQSYEDPAFDPFKKQCQTAPPFNFSYFCEPGIEASDADDLINACNAGYGLPPYKLFELPPEKVGAEKRYFFYSDDSYGPMNRSWRKPSLGAGFAGFQQINTSQCLSGGNHWDRNGKMSSWKSVRGNGGQGARNGKNFNGIVEFKSKYYFLILHVQYMKYWLDILPTEDIPTVCRWNPVKN